ncbi:MAG: N-acetylmuramic acid 6-phosphate etherase [Alphaproteobacteria bacterium]|nr:N-acetylmuramic acid 6-phosphate etherase [Alphaproteobacteria bacterium]
MINLNNLSTEQSNSATKNIDELDTLSMLKLINNEDKKVALAIESKLEILSQVVETMVATLQNGGRVIYMGAGTSGRLGILDASELPPTYNADPSWIMGLIAGGKDALTNAVENSEDNIELAIADLSFINFSKKDMLIGLAASGRTPYVASGLKYAKSLGAKTTAIACTVQSIIGKLADLVIEVELGGEVITGSTRMKAGTAQKMILNMLSTSTMIKMGKVYGNLMVDVQIKNQKLKQRAINIIKEITNLDEEAIIELLTKSNNNVKVAIVMHLANLNYNEAVEKLNQNGNFIGKTLK